MSNFFVDSETFNFRFNTCRACEYFFSPTASCKVCKCFMRVKCSISQMQCPKDKWMSVGNKLNKDNIPQYLIDEVLSLETQIKSKQLKDLDSKVKAIELYNAIYSGGYKTNTSCPSCLKEIHNGLINIINKYGKDNT